METSGTMLIPISFPSAVLPNVDTGGSNKQAHNLKFWTAPLDPKPCAQLNISSAESQKGAIADERCSIENQKGAIAIDIDSALSGSQRNIFELQ